MSYRSRKDRYRSSSYGGYHKAGNHIIKRIIIFLLILFITFEAISAMFITTYKMESISMEPTISAGDNLVATPVFFHPEIPFTGISFPGIRNPRRGEIILYKPAFYSEMPWYIKVPDSIIRFFTIQKKGFPGNEDNWSDSLMIKRVIGIPGDTVKFENNEVLIKPEGKSYFFSEKEILQTEYTITRYPAPDNWPEDFPFAGNMDEVVLGEDQYFLLGDNRSMSNDSYYQGPVDKKNITAKVILKYVPSIEIPQ